MSKIDVVVIRDLANFESMDCSRSKAVVYCQGYSGYQCYSQAVLEKVRTVYPYPREKLRRRWLYKNDEVKTIILIIIPRV